VPMTRYPIQKRTKQAPHATSRHLRALDLTKPNVSNTLGEHCIDTVMVGSRASVDMARAESTTASFVDAGSWSASELVA
jgi:hypothetical protein